MAHKVDGFRLQKEERELTRNTIIGSALLRDMTAKPHPLLGFREGCHPKQNFLSRLDDDVTVPAGCVLCVEDEFCSHRAWGAWE